MKKIITIIFCVFILNSCDTPPKILIDGVTYVELNVRAEPDASYESNIIDQLDPGDVVQIVSFQDKVDKGGVYWCQIMLDRIKKYQGKYIKYGWVAYSVKDLPYVVNTDTWKKIKRMYEMEHEQEYNEILLGSKTWLTQAIYDYVYDDYLKDIKYFYEEINENKDLNDNPTSRYELHQPSHSVDFTTEDTYPQYCRSRITSSSADRKETALYAVIFNQSPRNIHFFRHDDRNNRGKMIREFRFGDYINSNFKSIQRKTKSSRIYYTDSWGYKERLNTNYDAIRIRPHGSRDRYILYNAAGYTGDYMDEAYFRMVKEY